MVFIYLLCCTYLISYCDSIVRFYALFIYCCHSCLTTCLLLITITSRHAAMRQEGFTHRPARPSAPVSHAPGMTWRFWLYRHRPRLLPPPAASLRPSSIHARRLRPALACPTTHVSHAPVQIRNLIWYVDCHPLMKCACLHNTGEWNSVCYTSIDNCHFRELPAVGEYPSSTCYTDIFVLPVPVITVTWYIQYLLYLCFSITYLVK